ncbi:hypothetical protein CASFOL_012642 [Castilleja foliolosa]|uniref:Uncharacterized protein n=1 Tax=Castilleja foliolosa TaxID=1961234 RepID=A0ABD3DJH0_9LAMI
MASLVRFLAIVFVILMFTYATDWQRPIIALNIVDIRATMIRNVKRCVETGSLKRACAYSSAYSTDVFVPVESFLSSRVEKPITKKHTTDVVMNNMCLFSLISC